jgi:Fe-S cluster biogenesis protein NfuA
MIRCGLQPGDKYGMTFPLNDRILKAIHAPLAATRRRPMSNAFSGIKPDLNGVPVDASEIERMRALIETISAYIEYFHGGSVKMESYADGVLTIKMAGACQGCPLSAETLHGWVEGTVKQFFPDLKRVVAA